MWLWDSGDSSSPEDNCCVEFSRELTRDDYISKRVVPGKFRYVRSGHDLWNTVLFLGTGEEQRDLRSYRGVRISKVLI